MYVFKLYIYIYEHTILKVLLSKSSGHLFPKAWQVRGLEEVTLFFIDSSCAAAPVLLPEVHVDYGSAQVSSELLTVGDDGKNNAPR